MKRTHLNGAYTVLLVIWAVFAYNTLSVHSQPPAEAATLGTVRLPAAVLADGKLLQAGTYRVRLTNDQPATVIGETRGAEQWIEFVKDGTVAGREVATVVSGADIGTIAKGPMPGPNASRVDALKGGDYLRVWISHAGNHYIVNMPLAR